MCMDKKTLRKRYLAARTALSAGEKRGIDRAITENVLKSALYREAKCVFCYVSTAEEIDTRAILEAALRDGKTVCVPLCGRGGSMSARRITAFSDRAGFRLGYGGGYYDRFLAKTGAVCAALCAEARLTDALPAEPFDRRCDYIFTEGRILHTDEK